MAESVQIPRRLTMARRPAPDLVEAALEYARCGYPVLPVHYPTAGKCSCGAHRCKSVAKHPCLPGWQHTATIQERLIREWWSERPHVNIGILTGSQPPGGGRLTVLDVDPRSGGSESLAQLERQFGPLPNTATVRTGGSGLHFYFTAPVEIWNSTGELGPGLDIKGGGGFIIAPPSLHSSGRRYRWKKGFSLSEIVPTAIPKWLRELLQKGRHSHRLGTDPLGSLMADVVKEGARNDTLCRLAGHFFHSNLHPQLALKALISWNATRCRPPLEEFEVVAIANSVAGRELRRRRGY